MSLASRLLTILKPWSAAPQWQVAFSGGLDSTVLLHLLASLRESEPLPPVTAVHVHHGLQAVAEGWPAHCQAVCDRHGVRLDVLRVEVPQGASLENQAREARYRALAGHVPMGGVVLTAQHRDDQVETLLFRLFRGAGVLGLSGIQAQRRLGQGVLLRPLLGFARAELETYAREHRLAWVEDPSNQHLEYSRNYLRHRVLPPIRQRWPQADANIARAVGHCEEAQSLLDDLASLDLQAARVPSRLTWLPVPSLDLTVIAALPEPRQRNALRWWLRTFTPLPDSAHWAGWKTLRDAVPDACPFWRFSAGELHRGDGRLWWLADAWLSEPEATRIRIGQVQCALPGNGVVELLGNGCSGELEVRYRQGGERMRLPARGHRDLKRLLNEAGIPRFVRGRLPLLFQNGELIAVANLPQYDACGLSLTWAPPTIPGLS